MASALQPWDGAEDVHSWGLRHRREKRTWEVSDQKEIQQV